jgi:hypothetical protein
VVLKCGERLGVSEIGLLATVGVMMVKVLFCFSFLRLINMFIQNMRDCAVI